jgi:hypothetical protein
MNEEDKKKKRKENPAQYKKQGFFKGVFEKLVDLLIITDRQTRTKSVMSYTDYDNEYFSEIKIVPEELKIMIEHRLMDFHPKANPVLWRILITQALLYDALKNIRKDKEFRPYIKVLVVWKKITRSLPHQINAIYHTV